MKWHVYKSVMLVDDNEIDNIINEKIIEANSFADQISSVSRPDKKHWSTLSQQSGRCCTKASRDCVPGHQYAHHGWISVSGRF